MADIQHSSITDPHIHEPKGASTAGENTVYVSDGSGSGNWTVVGTDSMDFPGLVSELEAGIVDGSVSVDANVYVTAVIPDVSTADSVLVPIPDSYTVVGAEVVLGGAITDANASVSFLNSSGASMGTPVTIPFSGSGKGDQYSFTATGNNVIIGPSWIEVATDGASSGSQPVFVTVKLRGVINS